MTDEQYRIYTFSNVFDLKNLPNDEFERSKRFENSNIFNCLSVIASASFFIWRVAGFSPRLHTWPAVFGHAGPKWSATAWANAPILDRAGTIFGVNPRSSRARFVTSPMDAISTLRSALARPSARPVCD